MINYRYEIKFVLNQVELAKAKSWLSLYTSSLTSFPTRVVNSIYFDDIDFTSVRDNLSGIADRKKIRLRWYNNESRENVNDARLEIKYRTGRLGYKDKFKLLALEKELLSLKYFNLIQSIKNTINEEDGLTLNTYLAPTLHVCYKREYYEGQNGVRVTFDHPITFYEPYLAKGIFEGTGISYPNVIMEIKFSIEQKDAVAASLKHLNITPKRHSKYLVGLAACGKVLYI